MYKVRDNVFDVVRGWGKVTKKKTCHIFCYPVEVEFEDGVVIAYTTDGKHHKDDVNPSLFFEEVRLPKVSKPLDVEVGDIVQVGSVVRLVSEVNKEEKYLTCYASGATGGFKVEKDFESVTAVYKKIGGNR